MSHREFVAHYEWLELQWDIPDRGDHYLMKFMALVVSLMSKGHTAIDPNKFKVKFEKAKSNKDKANQAKIASKTAISRILKGSKAKPTYKTKPAN